MCVRGGRGFLTGLRALSREASNFGRRLIEWDDEAGEALERWRFLSAAWVYAALLTLLSVSNAC